MGKTITIRVETEKQQNLKNRLAILARQHNMSNGECLEWLIGLGEKQGV